jgi:Ser/Thr protein kinase RdoA (MazF antagonist)
MPENTTTSSTSEIVLQAMREHYAIEGSLSRLPGENLNYLVQTKTGEKYIAKIAGEEMPAELVDMEQAALQHAVRARLQLLLPQIIVNKFGNYETGINILNKSINRLRLLHYIDGTNLSEIADISTLLRFNLGKTLACFDQAMAGFDHPAAHRRHRWDLAAAGQHRAKTAWLADPEKRTLLSWAFAQIANCISPVLASLPWQFIHGDANPENIRVTGDRVVGLLDFGDSCYNPAVCDLAICLAYQMMDQADPRAAAAPVIAGYESVRPLTGSERRVLLPLVCGRLAVTISVAIERRRIDADNANWFVSENPAWRLLLYLKSSGQELFPLPHTVGAASRAERPL